MPPSPVKVTELPAWMVMDDGLRMSGGGFTVTEASWVRAWVSVTRTIAVPSTGELYTPVPGLTDADTAGDGVRVRSCRPTR